jgi:hypothetical protein
VAVTHESIHAWCGKFGAEFARRLRQRRRADRLRVLAGSPLRSGKRGGERCRAVGRFFVFIRHKENIQRLLVGAEPRIGKKG